MVNCTESKIVALLACENGSLRASSPFKYPPNNALVYGAKNA